MGWRPSNKLPGSRRPDEKPLRRERERKARERRGLVASIDTNLELLTLALFYHFPSQVNAFLPGNLEEILPLPESVKRIRTSCWVGQAACRRPLARLGNDYRRKNVSCTASNVANHGLTPGLMGQGCSSSCDPEYTRHVNFRDRWRGHLGQVRFASFAMVAWPS